MLIINGTLLPIGINKLLRMHWAVRKKEYKKFLANIENQNPEIRKQQFTDPVSIEYIRKSVRYMDWDNAAGSFKLIGDSLVELGVIIDDSPKYIPEFLVKQEKVKRDEQGFTVIIRKASTVREMRFE